MRSTGFLRPTALGVLVMVATTLLGTPARAQGFEFSPIVRPGEPSPDGGGFFRCDDCSVTIPGLHAFNNSGTVAIRPDPGICPNRLFLVSQASRVLLADTCNETPVGILAGLGRVSINDLEQTVLTGAPIVDGRFVEMVLLYSGGQVTKVAAEGELTPIGTVFGGMNCFTFGEPSINNNGEVAFGACTTDDIGRFFDGVFAYSGRVLRKVVVGGEPSPIGGTFSLNFLPPAQVRINNRGEMLFQAEVLFDGPPLRGTLGLFLAGQDGIKKIEVNGDQMPAGGTVTPRTFAFGDLNDNGDVAFTVGLTGTESDTGIFLYSEGSISKIMLEGETTPLGGKFSSLVSQRFTPPRLNNNGSVAFSAHMTDGPSPFGVFLASERAMVKVVAVGDRLPTGEKIKQIGSFALNDNGDIAFVAFRAKVEFDPLGLWLATPATPTISSAALKFKRGAFELRVNGSGFITNDSVIEINGEPVDERSYPEGFRKKGGTTTRVVSRDPMLDGLIPVGQSVSITVFNPLTNKRSQPFTLKR